MFQWWVKYKPYSRTLVLVNQGQWVIKPALIPSRSQKEDKTSKTGHNDTEKLVPEELSKGLVFNMCKGCWKEPSCVRYLLCKCSHGEKKKKNNFTHTHIFFPDVLPFTASVCLPGTPSYLLGEHYWCAQKRFWEDNSPLEMRAHS